MKKIFSQDRYKLVLLPISEQYPPRLGTLCSNNVHPLFVFTQEHISQDVLNKLAEYKKTEIKHLYLLDMKAEIKENDWFIPFITPHLAQCSDDGLKDSILSDDTQMAYDRSLVGKVIATTNTLITFYSEKEIDGFSGDMPFPSFESDFLLEYADRYTEENIINYVRIESVEWDVTNKCLASVESFDYPDPISGENEFELRIKISKNNTICLQEAKKNWTFDEIKPKLLEVIELGMSLRQDQLAGENTKSGVEVLEDWITKNM